RRINRNCRLPISIATPFPAPQSSAETRSRELGSVRERNSLGAVYDRAHSRTDVSRAVTDRAYSCAPERGSTSLVDDPVFLRRLLRPLVIRIPVMQMTILTGLVDFIVRDEQGVHVSGLYGFQRLRCGIL